MVLWYAIGCTTQTFIRSLTIKFHHPRVRPKGPFKPKQSSFGPCGSFSFKASTSRNPSKAGQIRKLPSNQVQTRGDRNAKDNDGRFFKLIIS